MFEKIDFEREKLNDLAHWFPILVDGIDRYNLDIKVPETHIIETDVDLIFLVEPDGREIKGLKEFLLKIESAADKVGYPFFLRTGLISGKHSWRYTCHVPDKESILKHVIALVEESEMAGIIGVPYNTWAVRKMLRVTPVFYAFQGLPVTSERRFFIKDDEVKYNIPYWPEMAIRKPSKENWKDLLKEVNAISEEDEKLLSDYCYGLARYIFNEAWSVDWLKTDDGWYLIDMALAERSWGYQEDLMK
jgi:hypothetical protein